MRIPKWPVSFHSHSTPSAANALEIHTRLAAIGSSHHRATDDAGGVRLWYRDPNGTDVALRLPLTPPLATDTGRRSTPIESLPAFRQPPAKVPFPLSEGRTRSPRPTRRSVRCHSRTGFGDYSSSRK